jgi:ATP-dependent Zn protease
VPIGVQVYVDRPDRLGRVEVLQVHLRNYDWDNESVSVGDVATATAGYTGAMLANVCNLAALMASRRGGRAIEQRDFVSALNYESQGMTVAPHGPRVTRRVALVEARTAPACLLCESCCRYARGWRWHTTGCG